MIGTEAVFVVSLDELNVPLVAVYSWPAVAVPFDVAYCTATTVSLAAGASVTVKSSVVSSPSVASASATDNQGANKTSVATATDSFRPSLVQIAPVSVKVALGARERERHGARARRRDGEIPHLVAALRQCRGHHGAAGRADRAAHLLRGRRHGFAELDLEVEGRAVVRARTSSNSTVRGSAISWLDPQAVPFVASLSSIRMRCLSSPSVWWR